MSTRRSSFFTFSIVALILCLVPLLLISSGCGKKKLTEQEMLVVDRFDPWARYLEDYNIDHQSYPETWDELVGWKQLSMPENPFTGQPMVALESAEFDPAISPGNFYYARVIRDEQVVNCQLVLFGEKGEIVRYSHSPMAAR
jgi:hypothetical protein